MKLSFAALFAAGVVCAFVTDATADPPTAAPPTLAMTSAPIFGNDAALGYGWEEIVVTLTNSGAAPKKGTLDLTATLPYGQNETFITRAPFNVPAGKTAIVRVPTHGFYYQAPSFMLSAKDEKGVEITGASVTTNMSVSPTLIDIDQTPRLGMVIRGRAVTTSYSTSSSGYYGYGTPPTSPALSVGAPTFDSTTGDPVLPQVAASYSGVTVAIIHSDLLAKLPPEELDALRDWVSGGGTLAVVPNRPEDLRAGNLVTMTGGPIVQGDVTATILALPAFPRAGAPGAWPGGGFGTSPTFTPPPPVPENDPLDYHPSHDATSPYRHISTSAAPAVPTAPSGGAMTALVKAKLVGFTGGNLVASEYGATASFGTGQVHLLAFDPTVAPGTDDGWVLARVIDMVQAAWDRQAPRAFPTGSGDRRYTYSRTDEVRRALDPNENFRPALGFAAVLLVIYSIVVGPVTFLRAQRKGTPLSPLKWAPLWSAATFASLVVVGLAVKGLRGRSRRVSLTEIGSGMTRGSITRFRGFYTSETKALSVAATDRSDVLDVMSSDSVMGADAVMRLDRGGSVLENITSLPWQTLVIREDGFRDLKGSVTLAGTGTALTAQNHTGQTIKDVLFYVPGDGIRYFTEMKDGETLTASAGKLVQSAYSRRSASAGSMTIHVLGEGEFAYSSAIAKKDGDRIEKTWKPVSSAAGEQVDWWPDDQPVLMGELDGGEGVKTDSSLRLETDHALLRVVGKGGAP